MSQHEMALNRRDLEQYFKGNDDRIGAAIPGMKHTIDYASGYAPSYSLNSSAAAMRSGTKDTSSHLAELSSRQLLQ